MKLMKENFSLIAAILVRKGAKYLLVKKPDDVGPYNGTYLLPGGGVMPGENVDDAVLRELYEETGVKVKNVKRSFFDEAQTLDWKGDHTHFVVLIYTGEYISGDLTPTEHNDDVFDVVDWFSPDQISTLPLSRQVKSQLIKLGVFK